MTFLANSFSKAKFNVAALGCQAFHSHVLSSLLLKIPFAGLWKPLGRLHGSPLPMESAMESVMIRWSLIADDFGVISRWGPLHFLKVVSMGGGALSF